MTVIRSHRRPARILVVAGRGYGKSTALDTELPPVARRLTAEAALSTDLRGGRWWGLDDLDRLTAERQAALVRRLAALPADVGVVLTSGHPVPTAVRSRWRGTVLHRSAEDLALGELAVMRLLRDEYGLSDPELAAPVRRATAGWPALVHLVADTLAGGVDLPDAVGPTSPVAGWVLADALPGVDADVRRWLGTMAFLGPVVAAVVDRLGAVGLPPVAVEDLHRLGLLVRDPERRGLRLVPVVAEVLRAHAEPVEPEVLRLASAAYERAGLWADAARAAHRAADTRVVRRLLTDHGEKMLAAGQAEQVGDLVAAHPRDARLTGLRAEAQRMTGAVAAARRTLAPLVARADRAGWEVPLACQVARLAFLRGDLTGTLAALALAQGQSPSVEWLSLRAHALTGLGRLPEAAQCAAAAHERAEAEGHDGHRAVAHLARARVGTWASMEADLEVAAAAAMAAGDLLSLAWARTNELHLLLAQARHAEAAALAPETVRLVEQVGPPGMRTTALTNAGSALTRTGDHEAAEWHLHRALALSRRHVPTRTATALLGLGDLHRELGRTERARQAYREAVSRSRPAGEGQVLVPALAGLARTEAPLNPQAAAELAAEALAVAIPPESPAALLAAGWVAWHRDAVGLARHHAVEAVTAARRHDCRDLLAESLELLATCSPDPDWHEPWRLWVDGGAAPAAARVLVAAGSGSDAAPDARGRARESARLLRRLGVGHVHDRALTEDWDTRPVRVRVLGTFEVVTEEGAVPWQAWRSRQARCLVRLLAAHRGRPMTRGALCEELWPGDDPSRTGHRLSVLLTTVRGVLDPGRQGPADAYVAADQAGVWLDLRHVSVDADDLVRDAATAADVLASGDLDRADDLLVQVDRCYRGDAFEDDPYQAWALPLREEARAAWLNAAAALAALRGEQGRVAEAHQLLLRVLLTDPYDERAHELLVRSLAAAGRHGEAGRALGRWERAMRSLGVPPPDPVRLGVRVPPPAHRPDVVTTQCGHHVRVVRDSWTPPARSRSRGPAPHHRRPGRR